MPPTRGLEPDGAPSFDPTAREARSLAPGVQPGAPLSAAGVRRLQRTAGNAATSRVVARSPGGRRRKPSGGRPPRNPPRYSVPLEKQRKHSSTFFWDPTEDPPTYKRAWTAWGYAKNYTAVNLKDKIGPRGLVGTEFENGTFPYVIDVKGDILIGKWFMPAAPEQYWPVRNPTLRDYSLGDLVAIMRGSNIPTETLIGGWNPEYLAGGRLHVSGGKIEWFDNVVDRFAAPRDSPPRESLDVAEEHFRRLPASLFAPRVKVKYHAFYLTGEAYTRTLRTIKTYPVKGRDFTTRTWIRPPDIPGSLRVRLRAGAGTAAVAAGGVVVDLALQYLASKVKEKFDNAIIERELKKLAPEDINKLAPDVKALLAEKREELKQLRHADSGAPIYLNVRFEIAFVQTDHYNQYEFPPAPSTLESPPVVKVHDAGYSRRSLDPAPIHANETGYGYTVLTTILPYSLLLGPQELVALENVPLQLPGGAGDSEIRDWLKGHAGADIAALPDWEKARLIHRLLDGWVSDDDLRAIESVCRAVTDKDEMERIDKAIRLRARTLWSARQREWLNRILDIRP